MLKVSSLDSIVNSFSNNLIFSCFIGAVSTLTLLKFSFDVTICVCHCSFFFSIKSFGYSNSYFFLLVKVVITVFFVAVCTSILVEICEICSFWCRISLRHDLTLTLVLNLWAPTNLVELLLNCHSDSYHCYYCHTLILLLPLTSAFY